MCDSGVTIPGTNYDPFNFTQSPLNALEDLFGLPSDLTDFSPDVPNPDDLAGGLSITIPEPVPRDPAQELTDVTNAQIALQPDIFKTNLKYEPLYAALDYAITNRFAPKYAQTGANVNTISRTSDVADLTKLAPQVSAAYRAANPEAAAMLDELNKEAMDQLKTGGALTPDEQRAVEQNARADYNDRGMVMGDPAVFTEVMNLDSAKRAKQQQNQQLASGVMGLNKSFYGDPTNVVLGRNSSNLGFSGIEPATTSDPYSIVSNPASAYTSDLYGQNATLSANAATNNANLSSDYFSMLYNAEMDANNTTANNNAALLSSIISGGTKVVSAGML